MPKRRNLTAMPPLPLRAERERARREAEERELAEAGRMRARPSPGARQRAAVYQQLLRSTREAAVVPTPAPVPRYPGALERTEPLVANPAAWAPVFQMDPETEWQGQLLDDRAETHGIDPDDVEMTPELRQAWYNYNYDLRQALGDWLADKNLSPRLLDEMYRADAEYNVYQTLVGAGVGIWDGRWDHILDRDQIEDLQKYLKRRIGQHVNDVGSGRLDEAMDEAVYRAPNRQVRALKRRLLR